MMSAFLVCLLSGIGGGAGARSEQPASSLEEAAGGGGGGTSTSDELSRAILATMSTQSPSDFANETTGSSSGGGANHEFNLDASSYAHNDPATTNTETRTILDRFLDFGRIFIMSAIIVGDICGNSLVILSVCRHTKLRVTTNWFVVSLACADILVALFAMTFNASVIISGRWLFKRWVCDFWNSCDVLASTASILHLCCISIDRYIAIMRPLDYPMKITTRRVMYALCGVWISSALLSYIPIFTGIYTTAEHIEWLRENPDQCDFVVNRVYAIVSSSISFWIPCCIMVFTYYRIYREATRQEKFIYNAQKIMPAPQSNHHHHHHHSNSSSSSKSNAAHKRRSKSVAAPSASAGADKQARIRHLANQQLEQQKQAAAASSVLATTDLNSAPSLAVCAADRAGSLQQLPLESQPLAASATDLNNNNNSNSNSGNGAASKAVVAFGEKPVPAASAAAAASQKQLEPEEPSDDEPDSNSGQSTPTKRSISKMKREHKAAKTLGIIMGVFILCWLPFFSWYTPQHICGHACDGMVPGWAVTILFWIGYFNSTLNPIIYAYFNHEFRDAFKKTLQWIFCCCQDLKCLRVNRPNDNQHYNCTYRSTQEIGLVSNG